MDGSSQMQILPQSLKFYFYAVLKLPTLYQIIHYNFKKKGYIKIQLQLITYKSQLITYFPGRGVRNLRCMVINRYTLTIR